MPPAVADRGMATGQCQLSAAKLERLTLVSALPVGRLPCSCVFSLQRLQSGQGEKGWESCGALCELCFSNDSFAIKLPDFRLALMHSL